MAAAAAAGGPGPGGGRRAVRAAATTNILAQLRHGQLSGCGLTRGAQVAGDGGVGWRRAGGPGLAGGEAGKCSDLGLGRGLLWLLCWAHPPPCPALASGRAFKPTREPGPAPVAAGSGCLAAPAAPRGGGHHAGAVPPLLEPLSRWEPRWPGRACRQGLLGGASVQTASPRPGWSALWGSRACLTSLALVLLLEGGRGSATSRDGEGPCLWASMLLFHPSHPCREPGAG